MAWIAYDDQYRVLAVSEEVRTLIIDGEQVDAVPIYALGDEPPIHVADTAGVRGSKQWLGPLPFWPVRVELEGPPGNKRIARIIGPGGEEATMPEVLRAAPPEVGP